ncbi:uncharacterized protein EAF01_011692 [Botrytis porri]|uniref:uncharacterized protein n=1 Tax=Botrytis porri TaxID=87229 RepID=UPI0019013196|nr:uncharacterized protein EAF01_011692 [Botrytis porri]KAF7883183.1 hypothetical protein EAF01_011692 [Botrytis porri]
MTTHSNSRSQYTPLATASDASIEDDPSNLAVLVKDARSSSLDSSSSTTDVEKAKPVSKSVFETDSMIPVGDKGKELSESQKLLKEGKSAIALESNGEEQFESESRPQSSSIKYSTVIENQSPVTGNGDFDQIKDPYQQDNEDSSSTQLTPRPTAEFVVDSDSQSIHQISAKTEIDRDAAASEVADATHEAETASETAAHLDSLYPMNPSVEQDNARRNATIKGLQKSTITAILHMFLAFTLIFALIYPKLNLLQDVRAYFHKSRDIRYCDVEDIPDVRLIEVLKQSRFHRIRSIVTPLIAWIWFYMFANGPELGGTNGTANATAVASVESTSHTLLEAINDATNATVKALINATAQA